MLTEQEIKSLETALHYRFADHNVLKVQLLWYVSCHADAPLPGQTQAKANEMREEYVQAIDRQNQRLLRVVREYLMQAGVPENSIAMVLRRYFYQYPLRRLAIQFNVLTADNSRQAFAQLMMILRAVWRDMQGDDQSIDIEKQFNKWLLSHIYDGLCACLREYQSDIRQQVAIGFGLCLPLAEDTTVWPAQQRLDDASSISQQVTLLLSQSCTLPLDPLKTTLSLSEDPALYYHQFLPYLLEELRVQVHAQLRVIARTRQKGMQASWTIGSREDLVDCRVELSLHEAYCGHQWLVFIEHPRVYVGEDLRGYMAIATRRLATQASVATTEWSMTVVGQGACSVLAAWQHQDLQVHWHFLLEVTPFERMYQACLARSCVVFERQFIYVNLPAWPLLQPDLFNGEQDQLVSQLSSVERGMYCIQGNVATGKTMTMVALIARLVQQSKRVLVTAPSHQALLVLLRLCQKTPWWAGVRSALLVDCHDGLNPSQEMDIEDYIPVKWLQPLLSMRDILMGQAVDARKIYEDLQAHVLFMYEDLQAHLASVYQPNDLGEWPRQMEAMIDVLADDVAACCAHSLDASDTGQTQLEHLLVTIGDTLCFLQAATDKIAQLMLQHAQLVFATLLSSGRSCLRDQSISVDVLLVDEADQAIIPELLIPMHFQPRLCIQVGDFYRFPAFVVSKRCCRGGLTTSMMQALLSVGRQPYGLLRSQCRMHHDLAAWPALMYYHGYLPNLSSLTERLSLWGAKPEWPLSLRYPGLFFNVGAQAQEDDPQLGLIARMLQRLLHLGVLPSQIGVLSFYQAQLKCLYEVLRRQLCVEYLQQLCIGLAECFQGSEYDVMLISTLPTVPAGECAVNDAHLHLAMTRARMVRWVFGDQEALANSHTAWRSFTEHHQQQGCLIQASSLEDLEETALTPLVACSDC